MSTGNAIITHLLQHTRIASGLADLFLEGLILLLLAGGVCAGWRRGAAAARHQVWFLAVAGLLALPLLIGIMPAWQRPLWTVNTGASTENEITFTFDLAPTRAALVPTAPNSDPGSSPATGPARLAPGQQLTAHMQTGWAVLAVAVWSAGGGIIVLSMVMAAFRLRSLGRQARAMGNEDWQALLNRLSKELRIGRRVTLLQSGEEVMPVTWGWWRPIILLPAEADDWSFERRQVVLMHELAHVKRWDCLTQFIAQVACAVYWFNPLVWIAARRMCVERERACDDLVLNSGCKASDYAAQLVEIARSFRRVPQVAAIAMARSSQLQGRIAAIVDASRVRRSPRPLLMAVGGLMVLAFTANLAAQKNGTDSATATGQDKPWYDARLRAFFLEKAAQARRLAGQDRVAPEVWPYFEAGERGEWLTATNLWSAMRKRAHQYEGTTVDDTLDKVWGPIFETDLAWQQFAGWKEKYVLAYGNDIIKSVPTGSIYLGGTDPGRGVITAMSESHPDGKPFYTITQNALADSTYLDYLQAMYGSSLYIPTKEDSQKSFVEYKAGAAQRLKEHHLKPGEDVYLKDGDLQVRGQVAVMTINGLITKTLFDQNPGRDFYVEESFPLEWMYPYLTPNGLIMKVNRQPLASLTPEAVQQDHDYWSNYLKPMLGDWLNDETTIAQTAEFVEKVYLRHDLDGFTGDPEFIEDTWARKAYSKLRSAIGGVYFWRISHANSPEEKELMTKAADSAFRQSFAICPDSPEVVYRYINLLLTDHRTGDAIIVLQTALKLDPENVQFKGTLDQLKSYKDANQ